MKEKKAKRTRRWITWMGEGQQEHRIERSEEERFRVNDREKLVWVHRQNE